jgi:hypothetical protein
MMDINQTPPEKMTSEQRRQEIAALLARGIVRLREQRLRVPLNFCVESEFELDSSGQGSVHSNPVNKTNTELE